MTIDQSILSTRVHLPENKKGTVAFIMDETTAVSLYALAVTGILAQWDEEIRWEYAHLLLFSTDEYMSLYFEETMNFPKYLRQLRLDIRKITKNK